MRHTFGNFASLQCWQWLWQTHLATENNLKLIHGRHTLGNFASLCFPVAFVVEMGVMMPIKYIEISCIQLWITFSYELHSLLQLAMNWRNSDERMTNVFGAKDSEKLPSLFHLHLSRLNIPNYNSLPQLHPKLCHTFYLSQSTFHIKPLAYVFFQNLKMISI